MALDEDDIFRSDQGRGRYRKIGLSIKRFRPQQKRVAEPRREVFSEFLETLLSQKIFLLKRLQYFYLTLQVYHEISSIKQQFVSFYFTTYLFIYTYYKKLSFIMNLTLKQQKSRVTL